MPDGAGTIAREHVEHYLANMRDRGLSPATVAKHYRSLQQLFKWSLREATEGPADALCRLVDQDVSIERAAALLELDATEIRRLAKLGSGRNGHNLTPVASMTTPPDSD